MKVSYNESYASYKFSFIFIRHLQTLVWQSNTVIVNLVLTTLTLMAAGERDKDMTSCQLTRVRFWTAFARTNLPVTFFLSDSGTWRPSLISVQFLDWCCLTLIICPGRKNSKCKGIDFFCRQFPLRGVRVATSFAAFSWIHLLSVSVSDRLNSIRINCLLKRSLQLIRPQDPGWEGTETTPSFQSLIGIILYTTGTGSITNPQSCSQSIRSQTKLAPIRSGKHIQTEPSVSKAKLCNKGAMVLTIMSGEVGADSTSSANFVKRTPQSQCHMLRARCWPCGS